MAKNGKQYRVRTLLDSGSGTNWIVRRVLNQLNHTVKAKNQLQVFTFNGVVKKLFTLVEVYIHDDKGKMRGIMCYMQEEYTRHYS